MSADDDAVLRRRAYARASVVLVVVTVATFVALVFAFPDAHRRSLLATLGAFDRQAWLIVAAAIATGCGVSAFVYARVSGGPKKPLT